MDVKLYVIIVTYNAMKWIDRCLSSVITSTIKSKIVVIDNNSTDNTVEYIKENFNEVIILPNNKNLGFGKANNLGIKYALDKNCDYVYLLNQDAWVEKDTFEILINSAEQNKEYGILSPLQVTANKTNLDKNFSKYCSSMYCNSLIDDLLLKKDRIQDIYQIDFVMAAHWLITKDCLKIIGGFNPSFPHYGEDENYIHRLTFHKLKVGICPKTSAVHDRENRIIHKKNIIFMNYIEYIKIYSNINLNLKSKISKIFRNFITTIRMCFSYCTLKPLINFFLFCIKLNYFNKNNKITKQKTSCFIYN